MSKKKTPKSNTIELLKQKVRRQSAAHDQLITPANTNVDAGKNTNINANVNAGENTDVNADENVSVNNNVDAGKNANVNTSVTVGADTNVDNNVGVDLQQAKQQVLERKKARPKKVKFDQKYDKMTFYILKELVDLINEEAAGEKGEKTRIINDALKMYFGLK